MTIVNTIISRTVMGNKRVVKGKSVISGDVATGEVVTGLSRIESFHIEVQGATQKGSSVNESLPLSSGTVTAVTESNNQTFYWTATGI
jgi:hypothetical protein